MDPDIDTDSSACVDYATVQAKLAAEYQASLARADGDRTAVDEAGLDALAALVQSITPLLRTILHDQLGRRFGGRIPHGLADECYAEMVAAVVEAVAVFDPARCPSFPSWVTGKQGLARAALMRCMSFAAGHDGLDPRALRVLAIASESEAALTRTLGRTPTTAELQNAMTDYCYRYQFDRLTPEQQHLPAREWRRVVHAKLVKDGMIRAITDIAELREIARTPVSPDEFATGWDCLEDAEMAAAPASARLDATEDDREVAELLAVGIAGLSSRDTQIVSARLTGKDEADASLTAVANRYRVTVAEVKDLVALATARMGAAHAHFAFLAPGVQSQFEDAPSTVSSGIDGLVGRLRPALV